MSLRQLILSSGLCKADSGLIQVLARHGSLLEQFLPAVIDFLLSVEHLLGRLRVRCSLLYFLRPAAVPVTYVASACSNAPLFSSLAAARSEFSRTASNWPLRTLLPRLA